MIEAYQYGVPSATMAIVIGVFEICLAYLIAFYQSVMWPVVIAAIVLIGLLTGVTLLAPDLLSAAFNPVTINVSRLCLCAIILFSQPQKV